MEKLETPKPSEESIEKSVTIKCKNNGCKLVGIKNCPTGETDEFRIELPSEQVYNCGDRQFWTSHLTSGALAVDEKLLFRITSKLKKKNKKTSYVFYLFAVSSHENIKVRRDIRLLRQLPN